MIELLTKICNLLWKRKKKKKKLLIRGIAEDQMLYLYLKKGSSDDLGN